MRTAWQAVGDNPLRFLGSSWPWRSFAYLLTTPLVAAPILVALLATTALGLATSPLVVGIVLLSAIPLYGVPIGRFERWRLRLMGHRIASPHAAIPDGTSRRRRFVFRRREPASLRELGYAVVLAVLLGLLAAVVVQFTIGMVALALVSPLIASFDVVSLGPWQLDSATEALPIALVFAPLWWVVSAYVVTVAAAAQADLARALLGPREDELREQLATLRRSRLDLVDAFETERRRIERHLHDGVQQRLVGLTMTLGLAELELGRAPGHELVHKAHGEAEAALADLREAVRGIHPRVLVDHGLEAAVREVADRSPVPVEVAIALPDRLPAPVEAAAYFVVTEGLANAAKHAAPTRCVVRGWLTGDVLTVTVTDDGAGGAVIGGGTGLTGLVTRLDALGGTLSVTSPAGGPTELRMECPWRSDR